MNRKKNKFSFVLSFEQTVLVCTLLLPSCICLQEAILLNASPAEIRQWQLPYKLRYDIGNFGQEYRFKPKEVALSKRPGITIEKYYQIEPSDAIDGIKYSQPALDYHQLHSYPGMKVPLLTSLKDRFFTIPSQNPSHLNSKEQTLPSFDATKSSYEPVRDLRLLEHKPERSSHIAEAVLGTEYVATDDKLNIAQSDGPNEDSTDSKLLGKNNFTDSLTSFLPVSSDAVLSYENPSSELDTEDSGFVVPVKKSSERAVEDLPSHYSENPKPSYSESNVSTLLPMLPKLTTQTSVVLSTHLYIELMNQTDSTENSVTMVVLPSMYETENISSSSPSLDNEKIKLSSGVVAGIVIGVLVCVTILSSAVIYLLYRKYNGKCTSVVEGKFNSDNCGYLDDSLRSSIYLNNHIELPKESSEEMSSLDNDSFLNSLETMTIQNYWADNSKNTKV
ncbi:uncharacterized protein TNCT_402111 [Trichonephila clavata]|uniref:Uncharacterized protein n=1 Tax=Trichonephila clavata TaxID=2740835 RepID=A0A8X6KCL3_TRICU|nr:uncharacterized protein TNCT_402111 [Trichonephila clavata]